MKTMKSLLGARIKELRKSRSMSQEQLADKIAILHGGKIIALDTLEGLKKLFPPAKVEYVEKQPTLEEIFLTIIGKKEEK